MIQTSDVRIRPENTVGYQTATRMGEITQT